MKEAAMKYKMFTERGAKPIKAWVDGVHLDENAKEQLVNVAKLPVIHKWVAVMPDVHWGMGATVGSVIPTKSAIIPAAVGVDIGCGMCAVKTTLKAKDLPDTLVPIRGAIERAVPHGRSKFGKRGDRGAWGNPPEENVKAFKALEAGYKRIIEKHPSLERNAHPLEHLGTLGTGNHFIEVCIDESQDVWFMLHSGSRGIGNRIGMHFIKLAKKDMERHERNLPDQNLSYLEEGSEHFDDYVEAVHWAQDYARLNRGRMMHAVTEAVRNTGLVPEFRADLMAVNCHHNYVEKEVHYGEEVFVTRKGAVRARKGDYGIIPGSMGAKSYIVCGKGHPEAFCSCSHGAGRMMSRTEAKRKFTVQDHEAATEGIECRKDKGVIDETPAAYKDIDAVMLAQEDLVDIVHTLKQVVCVKG
jgi:tRNA-splicing ligase RtcB (3'-phosphate/5'-hydroxy nucleic acid ligase)